MDKPNPQECPLCGGDNHCSMAAGRPAEQCWCVSAEISAEVLAKIPTADQGLRCICPSCAGASEETE